MPWSPIEVWLLKKFGNHIRSAVYAAFVSLLGVLAGVLGSLYTDDIKSAFPFVLTMSGPISMHAAFFWLCVILATFLFFLAQRASEVQRRESESRLDQRSEELVRLIRTMPPSDFLYAFRDIYQGCAAALNTVAGGSPTRDSVEKAIRVVCKGIATLARRFDGDSGQFVYAANVMRHRPVSGLDASQLSEIRKRLMFCEPEADVSTLEGVLDLDLKLSTATRLAGNEPDNQLKPLALPIPKVQKTTDGKWRVLPGAPLAFCQGAIDGYGDTSTLGEWCRNQGFSHGIAQAVEGYFRERSSTVKSFLSLPIKRFDDDTEIVGVLNIHRDRPNLLREKQPAEQFEPLVAPFQAILVQLLDMLEEKP